MFRHSVPTQRQMENTLPKGRGTHTHTHTHSHTHTHVTWIMESLGISGKKQRQLTLILGWGGGKGSVHSWGGGGMVVVGSRGRPRGQAGGEAGGLRGSPSGTTELVVRGSLRMTLGSGDKSLGLEILPFLAALAQS